MAASRKTPRCGEMKNISRGRCECSEWERINRCLQRLELHEIREERITLQVTSSMTETKALTVVFRSLAALISVCFFSGKI